MGKYYRGNTLDSIDDALAEITNATDIIKDNIQVLENYDWDEIFEEVSDSDDIKRDILRAIENISEALSEIIN